MRKNEIIKSFRTICLIVLLSISCVKTGIAAGSLEIKSLEQIPSLFSQTIEKEVDVNIRKRIQWVDANDGDAKITLQYASNSGEISITKDMNVVLIHDKSGSMDVNYGYHLELAKRDWKKKEKSIVYPVLNNQQWSDTILEANSETDLESEGADNYLNRLNAPNAFTKEKGAEIGYVDVKTNTSYMDYEMKFNSSCQMDHHYYLLIKKDQRSGIDAWRMVQGKNLYNIENTDLHHYTLIEETNEMTAREQAIQYMQQGCRVVRMTTDSKTYYSEYGETKITENLYFLDVSTLECYEGKWILNTCGESLCSENDRLEKSKQFMNTLAANILSLNPENQIAYIPFWGDVPEKGSWKNYKGNETGNGLLDISNYESLLTYAEGVGAVDFTSDSVSLQKQIDHSFAYNGTNWSKAFEKAVQFINEKKETEKETLVLFLTDGMPQGTEGTEQDYKNPLISGILEDQNGNLIGGSLYTLKNIEGVTVWAVGVGVNELDTTSLRNRLELINDDGQPFYARYTSDFESLKTDVLNKIQNTYVEKFYAINAFYQDSLSEHFQLDVSKLQGNWKILSKQAAGELVHGVPKNVYEAVCKNGVKTGITNVYVEDTKTIYWYLEKMTTGGFEELGHSLEIPIKFLQYSEHTNGNNKNLTANNSQMITYHTTLEPKQLYRISIDSPKLVFRRTNSQILVTKEVNEIKDYGREYHFSYSKDKCISGKVTNVIGAVSVNISAGATSGSNIIYGLENGTYYIYETDQNHVIVDPQVRKVVVDYQPTISTIEKNNIIPWAVTTSDDAILKNQDNYLILGAKGKVSFEKGAKLTIVKEIDSNEQICWEHGNPTFQVRVKGTGTDGVEYIFYHTFEFTREYVKNNTRNGKVSMSYTLNDIPVTERYEIEEIRTGRYELSNIYAMDEKSNSVGEMISVETSKNSPFYSKKAVVNVSENPQGITVYIYNKKINEQWFSHLCSVKNVINNK